MKGRSQQDRARYEKFRDEALATLPTIRDEIAHGFASHEVIKLCRRTNQQIDLAKKLFSEVDDDGIRELILKDVPELAGEKKKRLPDEEIRTVTINLDGLSREAIISRVVKAMRDVGMPEREIECFKDDAVNEKDYENLIATAIGWQAPVRFFKDGIPWFRGDWRRLTPWQRLRRRVSLLGGAYEHPDGYIELDTDEKAGINPGDDEKVQDAKLKAWNQQQGIKDLKWRWFLFGLIAATVLAKLFGWNIFGW
jgi:hypothetical protein